MVETDFPSIKAYHQQLDTLFSQRSPNSPELDMQGSDLWPFKVHYWHAYFTVLFPILSHSKQKPGTKKRYFEALYHIQDITKHFLDDIDTISSADVILTETKCIFSMLFLSYQIKATVPKGYWLKLHKIYYQASLWHHQGVCDKKTFEQIENQYIKILLISLFDPYQLICEEFDFISENIDGYLTPLVQISKGQYYNYKTIAVDATQDEPFIRHEEYVSYELDDSVCHLDLTEVSAFLNRKVWLGGPRLAFGLKAHRKQISLKHLSRIFSQSLAFINPRFSVHAQDPQACIVTNKFEYVWDSFARSSQLKTNYQFNQQEFESFKAQSNYLIEEDYCLQIQTHDSQIFEPNQLIGMHFSNSDNTFHLAEVCWAMLTRQKFIMLGVRKITTDPLACFFNYNGRQNQEQKGFLCYNYHEHKQGIYLITKHQKILLKRFVFIRTLSNPSAKHPFKIVGHVFSSQSYSVWRLAIPAHNSSRRHLPN